MSRVIKYFQWFKANLDIEQAARNAWTEKIVLIPAFSFMYSLYLTLFDRFQAVSAREFLIFWTLTGILVWFLFFAAFIISIRLRDKSWFRPWVENLDSEDSRNSLERTQNSVKGNWLRIGVIAFVRNHYIFKHIIDGTWFDTIMIIPLASLICGIYGFFFMSLDAVSSHEILDGIIHTGIMAWVLSCCGRLLACTYRRTQKDI